MASTAPAESSSSGQRASAPAPAPAATTGSATPAPSISSPPAPLASPVFSSSASSSRAGPSTPQPGSSFGGGGGAPSSKTTAATSVSALPSPQTQQHIAEARAALVASMSNMVDRELQGRASLLHANAAALSKQERDVAQGTEALRRENDRLAKVAREAERKVKEAGNVQNWAEVLERDFLVLKETMRLVREGGEDDSGSDSESWTGSYSGSEGEDGEVGDGEEEGRRRSRRGSDVSGVEEFLAKGKQNVAGAAAQGQGEDIEDAVVEDVDDTTGEGEGGGRKGGEGADVVMLGQHHHQQTAASSSGPFSPVNHAVAESISEAMATSLVDDDENGKPGLSEAVLQERGAAVDGDEMEVDPPPDPVRPAATEIPMEATLKDTQMGSAAV